MSYDTDKSVAIELDSFTETTGQLHAMRERIIKNLLRKLKHKQYSHTLAAKAWGHWYEAGAKRYVKEVALDEGRKAWSEMFPKCVRDIAAKSREQQEYSMMKAGEYSHLG